MATTHQIRECTEPSCRLRFPVDTRDRLGDRCPRCLGHTRLVLELSPPEQPILPSSIPRLPLAGLLDNVRSLFNVGSIFRSADGAGCSHLYLCGITPTPENRRLARTALGAELTLPWSHHNNSIVLAQRLVAEGHCLWALEESAKAEPLSAASPPQQPLVLVAGNEVVGVDPELLALCERHVSIPMHGYKRSLNVAVAVGVAMVLLSERS